MMIFFRNGQKTTGERGVQRPPPPWIKGLNGLYADFTWLGEGGVEAMNRSGIRIHFSVFICSIPVIATVDLIMSRIGPK